MPARLHVMAQSLPDRLNARALREGWPTVCDESLAFDSARLRDLAVIWEAVRGARLLPLRGDFTARALVRHLRDIAFVERVAEPGLPRRYRFGFYGSGMTRYTGDCTGKFLDAIIPEKFIDSWYAAYDAVLEFGAPLRFVSQFRALDLDFMNAESLMAPIGDADGLATGLLVSVVYTPRVT